MAVVAVGVVHVGVGQWLVGVQVAVPGAWRYRLGVPVVVLVLDVLVVMSDPGVDVFVFMAFGQV